MRIPSFAAARAWVEVPIEFRKDNDLIGMKTGVYEEELGGRFVYVSPAVYSLLESDRDLVLPGLMVSKDGQVVSIQDIGQ